MKKITLLCVVFFLLVFTNEIIAQTLNQAANWPNAAWTLSGTHDAGSLLANPATVDANLSYDDDNAGSGSTDILELASPIINLTAAHAAGETWISVEYDYDYNFGDIFNLEYYDADAASWVVWDAIADNSSATSNWCTEIVAPTVVSTVLNIDGFTATQLSGFQYRFNYDASSEWGWGFCLSSPTITSATPPTCPDSSDLTAANILDTSAQLSWTDNGSAASWNIEIVLAGSPATGVPTAAGVSNPYNASGLTAETDYDFYVQADCGVDGISNWVGPFSFTTGITLPGCGEEFFDSGADIANYSSSENLTWVIEPDAPGDAVTITFTHVDIEVSTTGAGNQDGCWDFLTIYNGPDTSSPILAQTLCGEESGDGGVPSDVNSELNIGDSFTSTHPSGALTVVFQSDSSVNETGWEADVTCNTLGLTDVENLAVFEYFPNPVNDKLSLRAQSNIQNISVYNILGQEVVRMAPNAISSDVDMTELNNGAYFVKVTINDKTETVKIIKK